MLGELRYQLHATVLSYFYMTNASNQFITYRLKQRDTRTNYDLLLGSKTKLVVVWLSGNALALINV